MSNDTAKTITTNIVPVQGTFEPLPPYECINLIGPAGTPFYAPVNPNLDGVAITNSTIDSSVIGGTTPAAGTFTNIATTTGTITSPPSGPTSIVNQAYVDAVAQGLAFKQPANYKSTGDLTLSGLGTQAGGDWASSLTAGMRILVTDQNTPSQNGIYVAASGAWSRSSDANTWDELVGAYLFVTSGAVWGGSSWVDTNQPGGTLGSTAVTFVQFSNNATYTAGTGLSLVGFQFSIANTGVAAATYGSASAVPVIAVNAQGQITSATNTNIAIGAAAITSGTIDSARISGNYSGITGVGTLTNLTVTNTINGSISGNAATATTAGSATTATTATNLAGGATGSVPYQSGAGATTFVGIGSTGQVLTVAGGVPTWATPATYGDVSGPASSVDNQIARFDGTTGKIIQTSAPTISDAGAIQNINELNFDTTPAGVVGGAGSMSWNTGDGTLDLVLDTDVTIQLGQENIVKVYNNSASIITNGSVVAVNGAQGQRPAVVLADADSEPLSAATLGVATEDIAVGAEGFVCTFGTIRGINTSAFTAGDPVYLSQTAGQFTKTRPSAPAHTVFLGWVIKVNASSGELFLNINNGWELDELHNVKITNVQNDDLLQYNSTGPYWENVAPSTVAVGTATNLAGGAAGSLPYQSGAGATTFLAAGSDGQVLKLASGVPTWSSDSSGVTITDDTTTNATRYITFSNLTTGNETTLDVSSTKLQFNPSSGILTATSFSGAGTGLTGTASSLSIGGNAATATSATSATSATTATNVAGGAANRIVYNTGSGATSFIAAPTVSNTYLEWSGSAFQWSSNPLGTVTSVGLSLPTEFTISNSPVTSSGTLTGAWASQTAKYVLAAPNASNGTPSFRALVASDIPTLNQNTTGSAASLSISGQSGLLTFTGLTSTNRAKTVRDAADTILELGGSYTPTGTWNWTSATATWPTFNQNTTGTASNVTGTVAVANGGTGATTLTGIIKGNGTSAFTAATAGTDYAKPDTASTWSANQTFNSGTIKLNGSTSGTATFNAPAVAGSNTYTLPPDACTLGYRNIPAVGTKTSSYTLATGDVGKYVQVGSGGSITIPDATFAEGDIVSIFNNTTGNITITCTITTAYIAGTDSDKASVTLATRGVATILFISSTVCVISGNVS